MFFKYDGAVHTNPRLVGFTVHHYMNVNYLLRYKIVMIDIRGKVNRRKNRVPLFLNFAMVNICHRKIHREIG